MRRSQYTGLALLGIVISAGGAVAQPRRVAGLPESTRAGSSKPQSFVRFGDLAYFTAETPALGRELYVTDGSTAGTSLVLDIYPGPTSSNPRALVVAEDRLFFVALDPDRSQGLWVIRVPGGAPEKVPIETLDSLYFYAQLLPVSSTVVTGDFGGIAVTDGTANGTKIFADITRPPNTGYDNWLWPWRTNVLFKELHNLNFVDPNRQQVGLNSLDPRTGAVAPVFGTSLGLSDFGGLGEFADGLFFSGRRQDIGIELWRTDGTSTGTSLVADLVSGSASSSPHGFRSFGNHTAFVTSNDSTCPVCTGGDLWWTDGTMPGTAQVRDTANAGFAKARILDFIGSALLFTNRPMQSTEQLWSVNLNNGAPTYLADLAGYRNALTPQADGKAWFSGVHDGIYGLVSTDGTPAGTKTEWASLEFPSGTETVRLLNEVLYVATDARGEEPWAFGLTNRSGSLLKDVAPDQTGQNPRWLVPAGRVALTSVDDDLGREDTWLLRSADTAPLLVQTSSELNAIAVDPLVATSSIVLAACTQTDAGASLCSYRPGVDDAFFPIANGQIDARFALGLKDGGIAIATPNELLVWSPKDDAMESLVTNCPYPRVTEAVSRLIFACGGDGRVRVIGNSGQDGTWLNPPTLQNAIDLTGAERFAFFAGFDSDAGWQPWVTDGSPEGTRPLRYITSALASSPVRPIGATLQDVYFLAGMEDAGTELWRTDGTTDGTQSILTTATTGRALNPQSFASIRGRAYFSISSLASGRELWTSDGTAAGTHQVVDLVEGEVGSQPEQLTAIGDGGWFAFTAWTPKLGVELWRSDGTAANTQLVADLQQGTESSSPGNLAATQDALYFTATDGDHGRAVWVVPLDDRFWGRTPCGCQTDGAAPLGLALVAWVFSLRRQRNRGRGPC